LVPGKLHLGYRRKRKDLPGEWLVRTYLGGERYQRVVLGTADDFKDASDDNDVLSFADAQRLAHAHRAERRKPSKGMTVADAIRQYVDHVRPERPATADHAQKTAARVILPALGRIKLADLTTDMVTNWRNALAAEPARLRSRPGSEKPKFRAAPATKDDLRARRATVNRIHALLRAACNLAYEKGQVADPRAWRIKPFKSVKSPRPNFLTVEECQRLINAADRDSGFRDVLHAALLTGARYGELCALNVSDFRRGKVHIRHSKSGKARDVTLTEEGTRFFARLAAGRDGSEPMLRRADGGRWKTSMQLRPMRAACKVAKISPPLKFHGLRHTFASLCAMSQMPLMVLAESLGHADTRTVTETYAHLTSDYIDEEIRRAAPRFGMVEGTNVQPLRRGKT
jgi:integrase